MFEILTVCTGNVCRSPLAEVLLRAALAGLPGRVHSAGTYDMGGAPMTSEAQRLALLHGAAGDEAASHRSQSLYDQDLHSPDLILVMTRGHRRELLDLVPARLRSVFTIREFARLAAKLSDAQLTATAAQVGPDPSARLRAAVALVAAGRGMAPADPTEDDVIDPYRQGWDTYQLTASQLVPAVDQVVRVVRLAVPAA